MESIPLLSVPRLMIQFICTPLIQQRLFEQRVFIHELLLPLAPVIPHNQEGNQVRQILEQRLIQDCSFCARGYLY